MIGTCRLLFRGQVARLGRLAVEPERRGDGSRPRSCARPTGSPPRRGADAIALHAQTYALALYRHAGYEERGPTFVEEGIEHVAMEKPLALSCASTR